MEPLLSCCVLCSKACMVSINVSGTTRPHTQIERFTRLPSILSRLDKKEACMVVTCLSLKAFLTYLVTKEVLPTLPTKRKKKN